MTTTARSGSELRRLMSMAAPVLVATVLFLSGALLVGRVMLLSGWGGRYGSTGVFQVDQCEAAGGRVSRQWRCQGELALAEDAGLTRSVLVASRDTVTSFRPYVGQRLDVFFRDDNIGRVYPQRSQVAELTRLFFSLFPRLLLFLGALTWLFGWLLSYQRKPDDNPTLVMVEGSRPRDRRFLVTGDRLGRLRRFSPQRLKKRGQAWMLTGAASAVILALLMRYVVGSLGIS